MATPLILPAPAKLNLFLHITGRRVDGYHNLQTVFQFVDLCDELVFYPRTDGQIRWRLPSPGLSPATDLCLRAARLLAAQQPSGVPGVDILCHKRIPLGAGLGGGSSDAATTLLALNHLWRLGLSRETLQVLGRRLGADVPVFIYGRSAWAEGVGERCYPYTPLTPWYVLVKPPCHSETAVVFKHPALSRSTPALPYPAMPALGSNDFLPVLLRLYPSFAEAYAWLSTQGSAYVTGSGSCLFTPCKSYQQGGAIVSACPANFQAFLVKGLNQSPLEAALNMYFK